MTLLSVIIFIAAISILIIVHELGHFGAARFFKLKVEEFGIGFPPRLFKKKGKETIYSINAIPLGGFVRLYGEGGLEKEEITEPERSFRHQKAWKRAIILAAGVVMNFIVGWLLLSTIFMVGLPQAMFVGDVSPQSPAAEAGIKKGDLIVGEYKNAEAFIEYIKANEGKELTLTINRHGDTFEVKAIPRVNPPEGEGRLGLIPIPIGVEKEGSIFKGLAEGGKTAIGMSFEIVNILGDIAKGLFMGNVKPLFEVSCPVGIIGLLGTAGSLGGLYLLQFLAVISLNLAVFNILPLPALDGGRLLFIIIEKIKGSPVKHVVENMANAIGFAVLILFMLVITIKDITNLF